MRKAVTGLLTVLLVGIFAAVVFAAVDPSGGDSVPAGTTTTTPDDSATRAPAARDRARERDDADEAEDISGPCDEAEHANDPRCTGSNAAARKPAPAPAAGQDISGPCDEAEHANDPRCTGAATPTGGRVDNSGPGSRNSGPGSVNSGRDDDADSDDRSRSGRRGGHDAADDDHGGSGGSGSDDSGGDDHGGSGRG